VNAGRRISRSAVYTTGFDWPEALTARAAAESVEPAGAALVILAICLALSIAATLVCVIAATRSPSMGRGGLAWFIAGFPAFHFPATLLAIGLSVTACATLGGAPGRIGVPAFMLGAIAAWALVVVKIRSHAIGSSFERALTETLGPHFRDGILRNSAERVSVNPLHLRRSDIRCRSNLAYGDAGLRNLLDIYEPLPRTDRSLAPVLMWIHGGAWVLGHKAQQGLPLMYAMAGRGWLVASVNYRLGPISRFPEALVDIKRAIAWLRLHASEHGGDPDFVIAAGGSAGGHLAALAAMTANQREYQPGFEQVDTTLAGCIPLYGRFDFIDRSNVLRRKQVIIDFLSAKVMPRPYQDDPAMWDRASPIALVSARTPPMFIAHGTHDSLIPIAEAAAFVAALRKVSQAPVVFAPLKGAQHAWDLFNTPWTRGTIDAVYEFSEYLYASRSSLAQRSAVK
jgi:acetyl esterase/lipase